MHLAAGAASKVVKLQRPARATVCSHSIRDATASIEPILYYRFPVPLEWSKVHASATKRMFSDVDQVQKVS